MGSLRGWATCTKEKKRQHLVVAAFSVLFAISLALGRSMGLGESFIAANGTHVFLVDALLYLLATAGIFFLVTAVIEFLERTPFKLRVTAQVKLRYFFLITALLFIAWLPYLLAYYPGILMPDSGGHIGQWASGTFNNSHPIFYTLLVCTAMSFGSLFGDITISVLFFTVFQMVLVAGGLSACTLWFMKRGAPRWFLILVVLFFALNPIIAMYAIAMLKDALFSVSLLLLTLFIYDLVHMPREQALRARSLAMLGVLCILVCFLRNNGVYAVCIALFALFVFYRGGRRFIFAASAAILCFILIVQGPLYTALGLKRGDFAEAVGIPLQQVGRVLWEDGNVTEEQQEFLDNIFTTEEAKDAYFSWTVDNIKFHEDFDTEFLNEHKIEFLQVWAKLLLQNPGTYVEAYLYETQGYWAVYSTGWVLPSQYSYEGLTPDDVLYNLNRVDLIQKMTGFDAAQTIETVFSDNHLNAIPFVSIPFLVWFCGFTGLFLFTQRRRAGLVALTPFLGIWLTMMIAAPAHYQFRYMYVFFLAIPFFFFMLLFEDNLPIQDEVPQNDASHCTQLGEEGGDAPVNHESDGEGREGGVEDEEKKIKQ